MLKNLILLFLLELLRPIHLSAQTYHNISLGTTLSPLTQPTSWLSPSGDFAFGFRPLETDPALFLLAVWFNKIANRTVVWTANRDNPVGKGSKAELTSDGQLSLRDSTGQEIWNPGIRNFSYGAMLDTGNFVLSTINSTIQWQSFDFPTDTILPGQSLNEGTSLYASLMDTDYSSGRFQMVMQSDGNLVFYAVGYPSTSQYGFYWASGTSGSGVQLKYDQSGSIYLYLGNSSVHAVISSSITGDGYQRATLDSDGIFRRNFESGLESEEKATVIDWEAGLGGGRR